MLELDLIQTLAFGGVVLLAGHGIRHWLPVLGRYNLPAPVVGGLVVAGVLLAAHLAGHTPVKFDTTLQNPLMIAFFTTIGLGASVARLRVGGPLVLRFFLVATLFAVLQNVVGIGIAWLFGLDPLFGMLVGSVTLTGGPATGLAFAPEFEAAGVQGAATVAVAAAMGGIVAGGLVGGPVATLLIERHRLRVPLAVPGRVSEHAPPPGGAVAPPAGGDDEAPLGVLVNVVVILVSMWLGAWVSKGFAALGLTLPATIGAMVVAAALRNLDDATGWLGLRERFIGEFGAVVLSLFLAVALMTLKLWELAGLAVPLLTILLVQVVVVAAFCAWPLFQLLGRDYESAVMNGGFIGFMLGTTANAMAVMRAIADRFGPAPAAFLVAPLVGAFFIDFANALIITLFLNLFS